MLEDQDDDVEEEEEFHEVDDDEKHKTTSPSAPSTATTTTTTTITDKPETQPQQGIDDNASVQQSKQIENELQSASEHSHSPPKQLDHVDGEQTAQSDEKAHDKEPEKSQIVASSTDEKPSNTKSTDWADIMYKQMENLTLKEEDADKSVPADAEEAATTVADNDESTSNDSTVKSLVDASDRVTPSDSKADAEAIVNEPAGDQADTLVDGADKPTEDEKEKELDLDEDVKNPQYIPKKGVFYEHDDRSQDVDSKKPASVTSTSIKKDEEPTSEANKESEAGKSTKTQEKPRENRRTGNRKPRTDSDRWSHDLFRDEKQKPKSKSELINSYGYDIRQERSSRTQNNDAKQQRGNNSAGSDNRPLGANQDNQRMRQANRDGRPGRQNQASSGSRDRRSNRNDRRPNNRNRVDASGIPIKRDQQQMGPRVVRPGGKSGNQKADISEPKQQISSQPSTQTSTVSQQQASNNNSSNSKRDSQFDGPRDRGTRNDNRERRGGHQDRSRDRHGATSSNNDDKLPPINTVMPPMTTWSNKMENSVLSQQSQQYSNRSHYNDRNQHHNEWTRRSNHFNSKANCEYEPIKTQTFENSRLSQAGMNRNFRDAREIINERRMQQQQQSQQNFQQKVSTMSGVEHHHQHPIHHHQQQSQRQTIANQPLHPVQLTGPNPYMMQPPQHQLQQQNLRTQQQVSQDIRQQPQHLASAGQNPAQTAQQFPGQQVARHPNPMQQGAAHQHQRQHQAAAAASQQQAQRRNMVMNDVDSNRLVTSSTANNDMLNSRPIIKTDTYTGAGVAPGAQGLQQQQQQPNHRSLGNAATAGAGAPMSQTQGSPGQAAGASHIVPSHLGAAAGSQAASHSYHYTQSNTSRDPAAAAAAMASAYHGYMPGGHSVMDTTRYHMTSQQLSDHGYMASPGGQTGADVAAAAAAAAAMHQQAGMYPTDTGSGGGTVASSAYLAQANSTISPSSNIPVTGAGPPAMAPVPYLQHSQYAPPPPYTNPYTQPQPNQAPPPQSNPAYPYWTYI